MTLLSWQALGAIDVEEEDKWTLEELGIDFPTEWASNEFLEGRNWWVQQARNTCRFFYLVTLHRFGTIQSASFGCRTPGRLP